MAIETWVGGAALTGSSTLAWSAVFGSSASELVSLANGSTILDGGFGDISNGTSCDMFMDFSFVLGSATTVAPNKVDLFLYPLLGDATTYGDGLLNTTPTAVAKSPSPGLWVGSAPLQLGASSLISGIIQRAILPPGTFRVALQNNAGVTFPASGLTGAWIRTYDRKVA